MRRVTRWENTGIASNMSSTVVAKIDEALRIAGGRGRCTLLRIQCKKERRHDFPSSAFILVVIH